VIAVVPHDRQPVFDIEVSKAHNFLANGVIAHNCSLYPTTIIAYNISWDTLVEDEKIPDELCHVMEWDDHIGCIVEGTLVTVGEYCLPIEQLNEPRIVLAYNSDKKGLSYYKQTNFFNQGIKDLDVLQIIKYYYLMENGKKLVILTLIKTVYLLGINHHITK
jgi:DNA polymerase elongation subunit (family B)